MKTRTESGKSVCECQTICFSILPHTTCDFIVKNFETLSRWLLWMSFSQHRSLSHLRLVSVRKSPNSPFILCAAVPILIHGLKTLAICCSPFLANQMAASLVSQQKRAGGLLDFGLSRGVSGAEAAKARLGLKMAHDPYGPGKR